MMRRSLILIYTGAASAFAQPMPHAGERVDGYLDRWDAWLEVIPEEDRALPLIDEFDEAMRDALESAGGNRYWADMPPGAGATESEHSDWNWTVQFIESSPAVIDLIHSYASMPAVGASLRSSSFEHWFRPRSTYALQIEPEPFALSDIAPGYWSSMREHTALLKADMYLAIEAGHDQRLLRGARAVLGIAKLGMVTGAWIDHNISLAHANRLVSPCINPDVDWSGISPETMQSLLELLDEITGLIEPADALRAQRNVAHDTFSWLSEDRTGERFGPLGIARRVDFNDGSLPVRPAWAASSDADRVQAALMAIVLQWAQAPVSDQASMIDAYFDAAIGISTGDILAIKSMPRLIQRVERDELIMDPRYAMVSHALESFNIGFNLGVYPTGLSAVRLRMCAEIHRRRHGQYPASIEALDADLQSSDFIDRFSGEPLRLSAAGDDLLIYSLGPDRDDDAGRPLLDRVGAPVDPPPYLTLDELQRKNESDPASIDGDWVLYPPAE